MHGNRENNDVVACETASAFVEDWHALEGLALLADAASRMTKGRWWLKGARELVLRDLLAILRREFRNRIRRSIV